MQIIDINKLKPYQKNAKKHPKDQIDKIARSLEEFGFNQPIVVDKDYTVIVGHGRLEAAKKLGYLEVPYIQVNLNEEQANAYRLADNRLNESEWDMDLVIAELKDLELKDFDISLTGFDLGELEPKEIIEDDFDTTPPEEPNAKLGDLYQLGNHRLMCGDSTKIEDVEKLMDGEKADMVFTDPPYNTGMSAKKMLIQLG